MFNIACLSTTTFCKLEVFVRISLRCLLLLIMGFGACASAQELSKYGSAFSGNQGVTVVLMPTVDERQALVQIKGVNHPVDGVVLLADKAVEGGRVFYRAQIDGRPRAVLRGEEYYGAPRLWVLLPGVRDPLPVSSDEAATKALNLGALLAEYQLQQQAGVQAKLAQFDRPAAQARAQQELADVDRAASQACGAAITTTVLWDSVSDDQLQRLSIPSFCAVVAGAMRSLCSNEPDIKPVMARTPQITCQFGARLRLRGEPGKLLFTTTESAPNQGEFALQYLRNYE